MSMPEKESTFVFRGLETSYRVLPTLEEMGIRIPPEHVAIVTDSSASYVQLRTTMTRILTPKLGHLTAKSQSYLHSMGLNAIRNLYMFDQWNARGIKFLADLISKIKADISDAGILQLYESIKDYSWLEEHPREWPINRGIVGKVDVLQVGKDLEIPDHLIEKVRRGMEQAVEVGGKVGTEVTEEEAQAQFRANLVLERELSVIGFTSAFEMAQKDRQEEFTCLLQRKSRLLPVIPRAQAGSKLWNRRTSVVDLLARVLFWFYRWRMIARRGRMITSRITMDPLDPDLDRQEDLSFIDNDPTALDTYEYEADERAFLYSERMQCASSPYRPWCGFVYCHNEEHQQYTTRSDEVGIDENLRSGCNHTGTHPYKRPFGKHDMSKTRDPRRHYRVGQRFANGQFVPPDGVHFVHSRDEWRRSVQNLGQIRCARSRTCEVCSKGHFTLEAAIRLFEGIPEPAHGEDHLVYTRTLCYAIAHFEWNEAWRPFFKERALNVLCSVFPEAEDRSHGWRIEKREWGVGHQLAWSTGRELRDTSEPFEVMCGRGFWRFVKRSSELATQIVSQFHEQTHHMPPDAVLHQLEEVGVKIPKVDSMIKQASAGCSVCHRNKVMLGHVSRLMKRDESGPIDLATVAHLNEATPSAYWVCDTAGPLKGS